MKKCLSCILTVVLMLSVLWHPVSIQKVSALEPGSAAVKSTGKMPCPAPVPAPQVRYCDGGNVILVGWLGCEYRVNGGEWKSTPGFDHLQEDTEYVFEQRWKETNVYAASQISEPLVVRTLKTGITVRKNYNQLVDYLDANGEKAEDGFKYITYVMSDDYGADYYLYLTKDGPITLGLYYDGVYATGIAFDLQVQIGACPSNMASNYEAILVINDTIVDQVDCHEIIYFTATDNDYTLKTACGGQYFTYEDTFALSNSGLELILAFWDETLYSELGFGLKGLGLSTYNGMGEALCNPGNGYHTGDYEVLYQRDPVCGTYGSNGFEFCTDCHLKVSDLGNIFSEEPCVYDNGCDPVCNRCGYFRNVRHRYISSCAELCMNCGDAREDPYYPHSPDQNGLCTVCGEQKRIPGDVTGDGKVNVADVSNLYAYVRGTKTITDPDALTAADLTGDRKINIADVSRLYEQNKK